MFITFPADVFFSDLSCLLRFMCATIVVSTHGAAEIGAVFTILGPFLRIKDL